MNAKILFSVVALAGMAITVHAQNPRSLHDAGVPPTLRSALYRSLASTARPDYRIDKNGFAKLRGSSLRASFRTSGARFSGADAPMVALDFVAWGRGATLSPVERVTPRINANRVSYNHHGLIEWWQVLPVGYEQGFTITHPPSGTGPLTLALASNQSPAASGSGFAWGKLHYSDLVVTDAAGKAVPATLKSEGNRLLIAVNDAHAAYPLTVDPLVWQEQKVTSSDGAVEDEFGYSVALDGTTALIGARTCGCQGPNPGYGAAYVFTKPAGSWTWTESQKLTADDAVPEEEFGWSVALSGSTALIGAPGANGANAGQGAAYIFTNSQGVWRQTQKLTANDGVANSLFGNAVALDGGTALIGSAFATIGGNADQGAVYVFTDSAGTWTQSQKLIDNSGAAYDLFGTSVALSGGTAFVGDLGPNAYQGAVFVFTNSDGIWNQTQELLSSDGAAGDQFGVSVAIYGNTALVGAYSATTVPPFTHQGAAYVFGESGGLWTQSQKLVVDIPPGGGGFGQSVALGGTTAVVTADNAVSVGNGFEGAAYVFTRSGGAWNQTRELSASDGTVNDFFGGSLTGVAVYGNTALVGAYNATIGNNAQQGAAYFYTNPFSGAAGRR